MTRASFALAALAALAACAPDEVLVATAEPRDGGDGRCQTNAECNPDSYCAKSDCGQRSGDCVLRPLVCDDTTSLTCGCDGVTYWNDCLRQRSGAFSGVMGRCATGEARCSDPSASECPVAGASCARLLPPSSTCLPSVSGVCWMLPDACPAVEPPERWETCGPPPHTCEDTCNAIRSGLPHRLHTGTMTCM